jgi:hydrogenase maturation factor
VLLADAQRSGGLLIAVARERAGVLVAALARRGAPAHAVIGELVAGTPGHIAITADWLGGGWRRLHPPLTRRVCSPAAHPRTGRSQ